MCIRAAEIDSFSTTQKTLKKEVQELESKIKAKVKECEKLRTELEVARNETQVESDSQLTVQAQLKTELKELLTENSEMKTKMKTKEEKVKTLEEKVACADKEKVSLLSKLEAAKRNFKKELDDQEEMYKAKIKGLEKMFDQLEEARAEVVSLKSNPELGTLPRKVLH